MMLPAARESGKIFKKTASFLVPERKCAKISSKFYVSAQLFQKALNNL